MSHLIHISFLELMMFDDGLYLHRPVKYPKMNRNKLIDHFVNIKGADYSFS